MTIYAWSPEGPPGGQKIGATQLKSELGVFSGDTPAANGTTEVAVANTNVTANSVITLTIKTSAGTPGGVFVFSKTPGTGFGFKGVAGDTSVYRYEIRN